MYNFYHSEIKFVDYSKWTFHFKPCLLTGSCQEMKKFASVNMRWKKEGILLADSTDNRSRLGQCWFLKNSWSESFSGRSSCLDRKIIGREDNSAENLPKICWCKSSLTRCYTYGVVCLVCCNQGVLKYVDTYKCL